MLVQVAAVINVFGVDKVEEPEAGVGLKLKIPVAELFAQGGAETGGALVHAQVGGVLQVVAGREEEEVVVEETAYEEEDEDADVA